MSLEIQTKQLEGDLRRAVADILVRLERLEAREVYADTLSEIAPMMGSMAVNGGAGVVDESGLHTDARMVDVNWFLPITTADGLRNDATNGVIYAMVYDGVRYIYAGGNFTKICGVAANYIARYDLTTRNWSQYNGGVNNTVYAIAIDTGGNILIGGTFTDAGGVANADGIAKSSGATWAALGTGVVASMGGESVYGIAVDSLNNYYVVGGFTSAGGVANTNGVAKWTGAAWAAMGSGSSVTLRCVTVDASNNVYVGGLRGNIGGLAANGIAKWSGAAWSVMGTGQDTAGNTVYSLAVDSANNIFAGGSFSGMNSVTGTSKIAKWDGAAWTSLGAGVTAGSGVQNLLIDDNDQVYAFGLFTVVDEITVTNCAVWDKTIWSTLSDTGTGGTDATITCSCQVDSGTIYFGGAFTYAGTAAARGAAAFVKPLNDAIDILASMFEFYLPKPVIKSYTPTISNVTNVAASTAYLTSYNETGDSVQVFGKVSIDPTAAGAIEITMNLPVASNLANDYELAGMAVCNAVNQNLRILGSASDVARFIGVVTDIANRDYSFNFVYKKI